MIHNHTYLDQYWLTIVTYCLLCFVRSADLDGGNRQVVIPDTYRPMGLAIYEEYIYWISKLESQDRIERANRFTGLNRQVIYNSTGWMWHLLVNHPSKQPAGIYHHATVQHIPPC